MNKKFFVILALAFTTQAHAGNLNLPVGDCSLSIPEKQWCGTFTVKQNRTMKYVAGPCKQGQMEIKYRAKSIALQGNKITIDNKYHFFVTWISPLGMQAKVSFEYDDEYGTHTGSRSLQCDQ